MDNPSEPPLVPLVVLPEPWISVLRHVEAGGMNAAALVLTARGIDNRTHRLDGVWHLLVRERDLPAAKLELAEHQKENRVVPRVRPPVLQTGNGWWAVAAFLAAIWLVPWIEGEFMVQSLRDTGAFDVGAFRDGAWWLPVTALTLHGDLAHIASNSLFGGLFGYLLGRFLGTGVGWLLTLLSAIAANMTSALIQPDDFRAIGASTAVFAALGLTGIYAWLRGAFASDDRRRRFAPAFAAIAMIALTGTGGENIDLFGHLFGFGYGCLAGWLATRLPAPALSAPGQWVCGGIAVAILLVCWAQAAVISTR